MSHNTYYLPYNKNLVPRAKQLRKKMTKAEQIIWFNYFQKFYPNILRQRPINNYIVDFYCPKFKLVIEIDGDSHLSPEAQEYDQKRTKILESYGLTVIRFTNQEVINNLEAVCKQIEQAIAAKRDPS